MGKLLKPLRVVAALACFTLVNAAFLAPMVAAALCEEYGGRWAALAPKWQLWPAIVAFDVAVLAAIAASALLIGRVYCSTVCPLGVFQDIVIRIRRMFGGKVVPGRCEAPSNRLRFAVFLLCAGCALCGLMAFPALIEPYSAYGRMVTHLLRPAMQWAVNLIAAWGEAHDKYWVMSDEIVVAGPLALAVASSSLLAIATLAASRGRWFCNAICPSGTVLSLLSKKPLVRLRIDSAKCVSCGLCVKTCKTGCIDIASGKIDDSRCVRCFNCIGACRKGALGL